MVKLMSDQFASLNGTTLALKFHQKKILMIIPFVYGMPKQENKQQDYMVIVVELKHSVSFLMV
ncbi:unnamed protein product [Paramecium octaurelia]|uniref:Uncharacterized protein n=1 Tax=Paramecium octaurelia TaxID=43137 RepID=A0A8S1U7V3_PAROT|nr:unnamed protein product [Paramecium octaurelia]